MRPAPPVHFVARSVAPMVGNIISEYHLQQRRRLSGKNVEETEYQDECLAHMLYMQQQTAFDPKMIDLQPELEWHMRPYLMDFLVESHQELRLNPETLFLAINMIDRYSSKRVVYKRHYQLVGTTALWIAAKYNDKKNRIPTIRELRALCCGAFESNMFLQMECHILSTLEWSIGHPTCDLYVDFHLHEWNFTNADPHLAVTAHQLALYMCELSAFHKSLLEFPASTIAACAVNMALLILKEPVVSYSSTAPEYVKCMELLAASLLTPTSCLEQKYSKPQHGQAFLIIEQFLATCRYQNPPVSNGPVPTPLISEASEDFASYADSLPSSSSSPLLYLASPSVAPKLASPHSSIASSTASPAMMGPATPDWLGSAGLAPTAKSQPQHQGLYLPGDFDMTAYSLSYSHSYL